MSVVINGVNFTGGTVNGETINAVDVISNGKRFNVWQNITTLIDGVNFAPIVGGVEHSDGNNQYTLDTGIKIVMGTNWFSSVVTKNILDFTGATNLSITFDYNKQGSSNTFARVGLIGKTVDYTFNGSGTATVNVDITGQKGNALYFYVGYTGNSSTNGNTYIRIKKVTVDGVKTMNNQQVITRDKTFTNWTKNSGNAFSFVPGSGLQLTTGTNWGVIVKSDEYRISDYNYICIRTDLSNSSSISDNKISYGSANAYYTAQTGDTITKIAITPNTNSNITISIYATTSTVCTIKNLWFE